MQAVAVERHVRVWKAESSFEVAARADNADAPRPGPAARTGRGRPLPLARVSGEHTAGTGR